MQKVKPDEKIIRFLFFGAILLIYLLFPSHNNSGDAWSMAADVKYSNELFSPHHLLYTATIYAFEQVTHFQNILLLGMICNAVFAFLSLILLFRLMNLLSSNMLKNLLLTAVVAFSFGFWRFATENETYIFPLFFSLLGSLYFIKYIIKTKYKSGYIFLSGIFASIACLYHQIHIFWFIGLFFGWLFIDHKLNIKKALVFGSTFLIAPLTYFLIIIFYLHQSLNWYNITHFVFHDYYIGAAGNHLGINNIFLGTINFIRTFLQVHGQMAFMTSKQPLWLLPGIFSVSLILFSTVLIFRKGDLTIFKKLLKENNIRQTHILIFILQLLFAIYNIGNAEFMVMLPALTAIILATTNLFPLKSYAFIAISFFIWNFAYGIYPNNSLHFNADDKITQFIIDHPKDKFVVAQPAVVLNRFYYQKGHWPENCWAAPEYYILHGSLSELSSKIDSTLLSGDNVYTDCTGRPEITSRESLLYCNNTFFKSYDLKDTVTVFKTIAGKHVVYRVISN